MQFLKKHYEKIILSAVLVGLVGALVWLAIQIGNEKQKLDDERTGITGNPKKYKPRDLAPFETALKQLDDQPAIELSGQHNLFSPVPWFVHPKDGKIQKVTGPNDVGPGALVITRMEPL